MYPASIQKYVYDQDKDAKSDALCFEINRAANWEFSWRRTCDGQVNDGRATPILHSPHLIWKNGVPEQQAG